jgi:hypothetical protein
MNIFNQLKGGDPVSRKVLENGVVTGLGGTL